MDVNLIDENIIFVALIIVSDIYLGLWVYFSNPKSEANRQFFSLTFLLLLWAVFCYAKSVLPPDISMVLVKSAYAIVALFFTVFYFFLNNFPKKEEKNAFWDSAIIATGVFLAIFPFYGSMVEGITSINGKNVPVLGSGRFIYFGIISALILFITGRFYKKYRNFSLEEKLRAQYFFIGFVGFILINFVFNIIVPLIEGNARYSCLGNHSAILFLILTAYAVVKHELMGIKILVTQILVGMISFILLLDLLFLSNGLPTQILKIGVLVVFIYCGHELVEGIRKEMKTREKILKINENLEERNQELHTLLQVSNMVNQDLDSRKISQDIVDSIPESLKYLGYVLGIIVLYNSDKDCVHVYAVTNSALAREVEKETHISIRNFREHLSKNQDLVVKAIKNKKIYTSDKLEDFLGSFMDGQKCYAVQKAIKAKSFISIPLVCGGKSIGVIVLLNQRDLDSITKRNKDIVRAFASHIGSAIENAQLYEKTDTQMKELSSLNRNLKKANVRLKELLEMKSEFLHITSHQLRTPLTAIRGMITMWIDGDFEKFSAKRKKEMLHRIYVSTEKLNNITNGMLDALELEGGVLKLETKKVSVMDMINDAVSTFQTDYDKKGLYLRFGQVDKDIPQIEAEPNYMSQVFMNLIDNACKYTKNGGVEIDVRNSGKFVDVYIKDSGIGMDRKEIKRAFEKFTRGKDAMIENASGSGLGLFIVKKILDEHNGKIAVKSDGFGKGTTFKLSLLIKQP